MTDEHKLAPGLLTPLCVTHETIDDLYVWCRSGELCTLVSGQPQGSTMAEPLSPGLCRPPYTLAFLTDCELGRENPSGPPVVNGTLLTKPGF